MTHILAENESKIVHPSIDEEREGTREVEGVIEDESAPLCVVPPHPQQAHDEGGVAEYDDPEGQHVQRRVRQVV